MEKKKYFYIDFIRIFSMLSVIILHVCADVLWAGKIDGAWHFANVITALCSASVPLFFMISGAMLLSDEKNADPLFVLRVRIKKVIIPFLFWSLFAVIYYRITESAYFGAEYTVALSVRIKNMLREPVVVHLWFMYALIPIYLLLPFIKRAADRADKKTAVYFIMLWCVFSVFIPTIRGFLNEEWKYYFSLHPQFDMNIFMGYPGFFILGYILHKEEIKIKKRWLLAYIVIIVSVVSAGTFALSENAGAYIESFKTYCGFFTASLSVALFLLFKEFYFGKEKIRFEKLIGSISAASFAIYLMHNLLINYMNLNYFLVPNGSVINTILKSLTVFIICYALTTFLGYVKPISFITTGIRKKQ